ncbi:MAG: T9SS type A sorting domain-containing protein [Bacteroidetes bacterium]|nr:T9SS type A sorting domain-containing protein [Bacteroidota bacterium]
MFILILLISPFISISQNAPITTAAMVANALPGPVAVPVTVSGFTNIGAISLSLAYDYAVAHYASVTKNPLLVGSLSTTDTDLGNGKHMIILSWYGNGVTVANGSTIFTITFTFLSGVTSLEWYDNGGSCQFASGASVILNDSPLASYYINGAICGGLDAPGPVSGDAAVCQGQSGVVYSVAPLLHAIGYNWSVPAGATITTGSTTNSVTVDFTGNAVSGNVSVNGINLCGSGPASLLPVTVHPLPVAHAGNDTTIPYGTWTTLHAAPGGAGLYTYHWSPEQLLVNPNIQHPQTVQLAATTLFNLVVTNQATFCHDSSKVIVTITGGPLSTNPAAIPNGACAGQVVQLYANAGGGSGNYSYQWSSNPSGTPPWSSNLQNPQVSPAVSTQYLLMVNDGFNAVSNATNVTVYPLPTATISGGDSLCDDGSETTLAIALTGTPPWSFTYSDGTTSVTVSNQVATPFLLTTSMPGTYTLLATSDANCSGTTSGTAVVVVSPIPATPVISQNGNVLSSNQCCGNQWYLDGVPVQGATAQSFVPVHSGSYFDRIVMNGCTSDTSNLIDIIITGTGELARNPARLYPNPARENVYYRCPEEGCLDTRIRIINPMGRVVKEFLWDQKLPGDERQIDASEWLPGIYFAEIQEESGIFISKLIIN